LVDSGHRVRIIVAGVTAWSVFTAACAIASSFAQLLVCRAGVGAGEATLTPAAHSILADSFPRRRLGLALGIFGIGSYIGSGIGLLIGSVIMANLPHDRLITLPFAGVVHPWQAVFLSIGLPGIPMAIWIASLREPPRRSDHETRVCLTDVIHYLRVNARSIVLVNLMGAFVAMAGYAAGAWIPTYFIRAFGWAAMQAGMAYGVITIVCGVGGVIGGGALSDITVSNGFLSGRPIVMALASLCAMPFACAAALVGQAALSLTVLVPFIFLTTVALGILPAAQQAMTPSRMRGVVAALGVLMVNLIGLGIGPTAIALMTDYTFHDPAKVGRSLSLLLPLMLLVSALCGFCALGPYWTSIVRLNR
jgi:predicted MFS family arabinose efflux permease